MLGANRTTRGGSSPLTRQADGQYPPPMGIRLVLAEDNVLIREGVRALIELEDDLNLVGVSEDFDTLLDSSPSTNPTSSSPTSACLRPAPTRASGRLAELQETHPDIGVVVLSHYLEPAYALSLFADGAERRGYLLKERVADGEQLASAIREVAPWRHGRRSHGRRRPVGRARRERARRSRRSRRASAKR